MKLKDKIDRLSDRTDDCIRRFCGAMSPDTRVIVIVIMIVVFGGLNIYWTVSAIYRAGRTDERKELMEIKHITPITPPDSGKEEVTNPLTDQENDRPDQEDQQ